MSTTRGLSLFVVLVATILLQLSQRANAKDNWERSKIIGAWRDNYNRTVYVCASYKSHDHAIYMSVSAPGAPVNTTYFVWGNYSRNEDRERVVRGKVYWFNKTDGGMSLHKDHFDLRWNGEDDNDEEAALNNRTFTGTFIKDQKWILAKRLYKREPSPSICWKPEVWQLSSRLPGRWQRSTSAGDYITVNICPAHGDRLGQEGQWQYSLKGTGGKFRRADFENANMTMWAIGKETNTTDSDISDTGHAFVQSGLTILTEVIIDPTGRFQERAFYQYIGQVDVEACNLPTNIYFPIPYARLSLLTYPAIGLGTLIFTAGLGCYNRRRIRKARLVG